MKPFSSQITWLFKKENTQNLETEHKMASIVDKTKEKRKGKKWLTEILRPKPFSFDE